MRMNQTNPLLLIQNKTKIKSFSIAKTNQIFYANSIQNKQNRF
jgi:hypothetical protein